MIQAAGCYVRNFGGLGIGLHGSIDRGPQSRPQCIMILIVKTPLMKDQMTLEQVDGPYPILGSQQAMVYDLYRVDHSVLKVHEGASDLESPNALSG